MALVFNLQASCPECGCTTIVKEEVDVDRFYKPPRIREHVNGGRWETRTFMCGYSCQYVPNFCRNEAKYRCQGTPDFKEREKKREQLQKKIRELESQLREI